MLVSIFCTLSVQYIYFLIEHLRPESVANYFLIKILSLQSFLTFSQECSKISTKLINQMSLIGISVRYLGTTFEKNERVQSNKFRGKIMLRWVRVVGIRLIFRFRFFI